MPHGVGLPDHSSDYNSSLLLRNASHSALSVLKASALAATSERNSNPTCAAAWAVICPWSKAGNTSTTSPPTQFTSLNARRYCKPICVDGPPTSGVPVPGAYAGSKKSTSNERKVGFWPTMRRTAAPSTRGLREPRSEVGRTLKPRSIASCRSCNYKVKPETRC